MPGYNQRQKESLSELGPRKNYWVWGADGVRRGPAALNKDGVKRMQERGATCVPLKQGEFYTMERKPES